MNDCVYPTECLSSVIFLGIRSVVIIVLLSVIKTGVRNFYNDFVYLEADRNFQVAEGSR